MNQDINSLFFISGSDENNNQERVFYHCKDCDCSFYHDNLSSVTCVLCNSNNIEELKESEKVESSFIIPFSKSMEVAVSRYRKTFLWNPFIPLSLKKKKVYQSIKRVYVPAYLLDISVLGNIAYQAIDKHNNKQEKYNTVIQANFDYNQVVFKKCTVLKDSLFESINDFNSSNLTDYEASLVHDTYIIKDNLNSSEVSDKMRDRVIRKCLKMSEDGVVHDKKRVMQNGLEISSHNVKNVLVPIYYLKMSYHGKESYYIMNGENGKYKYNTVYSKIGIAVFSIVIFLIIFLISYLIFIYL